MRRRRGWGGKESATLVLAIMEMHLVALVFTISLVFAADLGKHRTSLAGIIIYNFSGFNLFHR